MNIYAEPGSKVIFLNKHGYESQREYALVCGLEEGGVYTVRHTEISQSSTIVYLYEFATGFNSVMFEDFMEEDFMEEEFLDTGPDFCQLGELPTEPYGSFLANAQGAGDFQVEVVNVNNKMTICAEEGAIYITKEQAAKFFGFTELDAEQQLYVDIKNALKYKDSSKTVEQKIDSYRWNGQNYDVTTVWVPVVEASINFNLIHNYRIKP